jgi:recombinational DNA repair protein (RecF pathway)
LEGIVVSTFTVDTGGIRAIAAGSTAARDRLSALAQLSAPGTGATTVDGGVREVTSVVQAHVQAAATGVGGQAGAASAAAAAYERADAGVAHAARGGN